MCVCLGVRVCVFAGSACPSLWTLQLNQTCGCWISLAEILANLITFLTSTQGHCCLKQFPLNDCCCFWAKLCKEMQRSKWCELQIDGSSSSSLLEKNVLFSSSCSCFCFHMLKKMLQAGSKCTANLKLLLGNFPLNIATISHRGDVNIIDKVEMRLFLTFSVGAWESCLLLAVCCYLEHCWHSNALNVSTYFIMQYVTKQQHLNI